MACGDDGAPADSAVPDATPDSGVGVAAPEIPWIADGVPEIVLTPCPEGWRESDVLGVTECDPYPPLGRTPCGLPGEAHFPGEAGCRPIGDPCPTGEFAEGLPTDDSVIYVSAAAAPGGDGGSASPFTALSDVRWSALSSGAVVAIGRGTYEGTLPLEAGVRVVGACVAETILTGVDFPAPAVVSVTTAGEPASVRNVTIRDAPQRGAQAERGRTLELRGVHVERASEHGVFVFDEGTTLTLVDVVIEGTLPRAGSGTGGRGAQVGSGATLDGTRVIFGDNHDVGVIVGQAGSSARLVDSVVRDTRAQELDFGGGRGLNVQEAGRLVAERLLVDGNLEIGLVASGPGTELTLTDVIVRDTAARERDGMLGRGIELQDGAHLAANRLVVRGNRHTGIFAADDRTEIVLEDAVVRNTAPQSSDDRGGRGVNVQAGALVTAARLLVSSNHEVGIFASDFGTRIELEDVAVRETEARALDGGGGRGIGVQGGAHLTALRLVVDEGREVGLYAADEGSVVSLMDAVVRRTLPQTSDDSAGRGVQVQGGAGLDGVRVEVDASREVGIAVLTGAAVDLSDARVTLVERAACAMTSCMDAPFGYAVSVGSATLRLTRFSIDRAATCGVLLAPDHELSEPPEADLASGVVSGSPIGACVQVDGYDLSRLTNGVAYRDNGINLESTMLPVPQPVERVME